MSDEQYLEDPDERDDDVVTDEDNSLKSVDEMRKDDPLYAPQSPGDPGYEPPAVIPELDLEGGTKFVAGDQEFASMKEASEALAPDDEAVVEEDEDAAVTPETQEV